MTTIPRTVPSLRTIASRLLVAAAAGLAGCANQTAQAPAASEAAPAVAVPARQIADLTQSLRCMDNLFVDFGVGNITIAIDDLTDQTARKTGSRESLAAALAQMTTRSRAIRLVADPTRRERAPSSPHYALRGSITGEGVQLTLINAADGAIVPGAGARETLTRVRQGAGSRTTTEIRKFGERFGIAAGADESRVLIELAAIDVAGKLTRVPYWTCLGITDQNDTVAAEIQDWFDAMVERPAEIIGYFQRQLKLRTVYPGDVTGTANPEFREAIARYREALGLSREAKFSLDFYQAYLSADHRTLVERIHAAAAAERARQPAPEPVPAQVEVAAAPAITIEARPLPAPVPEVPLALRVESANAQTRFARGEVIKFNVMPSRDANVYCYMQDEDRKVRQVFPNRFHRDSRVSASSGLQLPGAMRFEISMNPRGQRETLLCMAAPRDLAPSLSPRIAGRDFEPLAVQSLDEVRRAFQLVSGGQLAADQFHMLPR